MSLDERKRKESLTRDRLLTDPNFRETVRQEMQKEQRKDLLHLREQVERSKLAKEQQKQLKKQVAEQSIAADAKLGFKQFKQMEQKKRKVEKQQGQRERVRKAA